MAFLCVFYEFVFFKVRLLVEEKEILKGSVNELEGSLRIEEKKLFEIG